MISLASHVFMLRRGGCVVALQWPDLANACDVRCHRRGRRRRAGDPVSYAGVARRSTVGVGAPGVGVGAPGVGVTPGVGVGAPGVGATPVPGVGTPANRGGPVNRVGVR